MTFGKGSRLRQHSHYLRDPQERHARILDVTERNSIIEGLPPFTPKDRKRILKKLRSS